MKMKAAKKVSYDSGPNMTPLVDVVMVILIFLMMVGQFGSLEHYLLSNVPLISDGPTQEVRSLTEVKDTIEISVKSTPGGFEAGVVGGNIRVERGTLDEVLQRMKTKFNEAGRSPDQIQVIISPQRTVKWADLVKVYESALRAKYTKIAFRSLS